MLNLYITTINLKFQLRLGMMNLIYLMDHILFQTLKNILSMLFIKHETIADNLLLQICPNKIENTIVFKVKTGYKLELLSPEIKKLLGSAKKDIDKDKDGEDVPKLESVAVVLVHCNLVNNSYLQESKVLFTFVPNKQFCQLITISPHSLTMLKTTNADFQSIEL